MKPFIPIVVLAIFLSSCSAMFNAQKGICLVDADKDKLKVKVNNEPMEIVNVRAFGGSQTAYHITGLKFKIKKDPVIKFEYEGYSNTMVLETRPAWFWLIGGGLFTFGVSPIVDFATGYWRVPKRRFVDVPAVLNGTPQRSRRKLIKHIKQNYTFEEMYPNNMKSE